MDLNKYHEFEFTKNVTLAEQYKKVIEESVEIIEEYGSIAELLKDEKNIGSVELKERLKRLENEALDLSLASLNLYKVSSKIGKKRYSFIEWLEKLSDYAKGKYKELVE